MNRKRVLVVEDDAFLALDIADLLQEAGYAVVGPVDRLGSALDLAESADFDAAVLDVDLAGVKVWPAADVLAARRIPFVLLTGYDGGDAAPGMLARIPRLTKPFTSATLLQGLAAALQGEAA